MRERLAALAQKWREIALENEKTAKQKMLEADALMAEAKLRNAMAKALLTELGSVK